MSETGAVVALMKAAAQVRDGGWVNGAPSHIFPELVRALEAVGWELRKLPCPECHGYGQVQKIEMGDYGNGQGWGNLSFKPCPRGCPMVTVQL